MASASGMSFNDLISPVTVRTFFDTHHHQKWLHVPGTETKSMRVFSWDGFNEILNMDVWTPNTMQIVLDTERVPPPVFCEATVNRNKQNIMQPKPDNVIELLRQGASLVLNEIETLSPGPGAVVETLERTLNAKASANLYYSWQQRQAFDSHYDRHDVYAVQIVGEKRWQVYHGRVQAVVGCE